MKGLCSVLEQFADRFKDLPHCSRIMATTGSLQ
jgi:hypothetical protein